MQVDICTYPLPALTKIYVHLSENLELPAGEDTDMPSHVEEAEEFLDREEDDGVKLEPFNLAQERAEGHFDESGHYVENKKDDAEETDAWLGSDDVVLVPAAPVSDTVKRQILERQQRMAAAEEAPEMSKPQEAALQRDIAAILLPGESVTKALQRLGKQDKRPAGKRNKDLQPKVELSAEEKQIARQQFEKLTEAASSLMDSGELDIYSQKKEYLERCAALFAPAADIFGHEDDMFAENAENEPQQVPISAAPSRISALTTPRVSFSFPEVMGDSNGSTPRLHSASPTDGPWQVHSPRESAAAEPSTTADTSDAAEQSPAVENGDAAQPANGHLSAAEAEVDYQSWPIKELRRFLTERGLDCAGIIEKRELAEKVKQAASQGPEGQVSTVPVGYAFDPSSGYHYSADTQMYFDSNSGGYYSNSDSKWYLYNEATQQFQEWQQQPS
ncbi:MAG: hypothetical protein FRX49_07565 [Trebouxia sp. A1-2]|nr:MAG: hypothetical protein FRX49_07565 [Trebouxia sp. A1-2]